MKKILVSLTILTGCFLTLSGQSEMRLMRFPAIHGDQVVFSYAGDLYTVTTDGGIARRITSDQGYEMFPRFSPDGRYVAFTGQYDGNTEVYVIPSSGGLPRRLTYTATLNRDDISDRMGPNNIVMTWTPDGKKIIYRSRQYSFNDFVGHLFAVPLEGGLSEQLPFSSGGFCSYSPDGSKLAFNRVFREFRTWKYYRGGMADDIRIFDFATQEITRITSEPSQEIIPMWYGNKIYYLSDRDRTMNLFVYDLNTGVNKKVTHYTDYDIKFPSLGNEKIIFEQAGYLHILDLSTESIRKLNIIIADDQEPGKMVRRDGNRFIQQVSLSPDAKRVVVTARGDIFTVPVENGNTRQLTNSSGSHERSAVWSPDGKWIAFLSDMSGEYEIYLQPQDGSTPPEKLTEGNDNYLYELKWSHDSHKILFNDRKQRLRYVDVETGKITLVATSKVWEYNDFNWSPDSKWITYTQPLGSGMSQIMLYNVATGNLYSVTDPWYSSSDPVFSTNGKFLLFVSQRDFSPIYSNTEWNHAYKNMDRVYMVPLSKTTPNPLREKNDEVNVTEKETEIPASQDKKDPKKESGVNQEPVAKDMIVDTENIENRIIALPIRPSNYSNITMIDSKIYYLENYFGEKGFRIILFDPDTRKETTIAENMGYSISLDKKKMMLVSKGKYYVVPLPAIAAKTEKSIDFSNMGIQRDLNAEWQQIYHESWRQMRDFFYDENMHGVDWKAMEDKYALLLPYVSNRNDLNYLIGELIGELNVGHAYVSGGDKYEPERVKTGLLGAVLDRDKTGYYRITRILEGQNWDEGLVSPLTQVGVDVKAGEYIIAIDGKDLKEVKDIYAILAGKANTPVELTINGSPVVSGSRKVLIRTIDNELQLYYFNWVQENIRKVSEATNGEVGYLHIPDMVTFGLNEFVKYYYPQLTKRALIIDGRGNGGGNVSPMIIERLRREIIRVSAPRNVEEVSGTPRGMTGPMVLLINQYSASDGDLFPYAFKKLGIGTVIGVRTWGGVTGIRGSLPFVDNGNLNKPEYGTYSSETGQWIIEGHGVDPDIEIDNDPYREFMGTDDQLNKAIEVILQQLKDAYQLPPKPQGPERGR